MRRVSVYRPNQKVRNPQRHIRSLKKWTSQFEGNYPTEQLGAPYQRWKIPVLDRFIQGRTTTPEIQKECVWQMIQALEHLVAARPAGIASRVVVLITLPNLFDTEIRIFQSPEYMDSFYKNADDIGRLIPVEKSEESQIDQLVPFFPLFMQRKGYKVITANEGATGSIHTKELWVLGETLPIETYK